MATLSNSLPTLLDLMKARDPNGAVAQTVELMTKRNTLLGTAVWQEGNLDTGHQFTSRTALPSLQWRRMNQGITPSKSQRGQVTETCGQVAGFSVVDIDEYRMNGGGEFRQSEDMGFVQAMNNEIETGVFYHSTKTAPEKFMGLSPRLDSTANPFGAQIIKADASASGSDQTSVWLVGWSPKTVFMMYPKGTKGGLTPHDMGEQLWDDGSGAKFRALVTEWKWNVGLCVRDARYVVRIPNIDTGNLSATNDTLIQAMVKATHQVQDLTNARFAFYGNRTVGTFLHLQALNNTKNSTLTIEDAGGQPVTKFLGIPFCETDSILNTEAVVS